MLALSILAIGFGIAFAVMIITFIYTCIVFYRRGRKQDRPFVDKLGRLFRNKRAYDKRLKELSKRNWEDIFE